MVGSLGQLCASCLRSCNRTCTSPGLWVKASRLFRTLINMNRVSTSTNVNNSGLIVASVHLNFLAKLISVRKKIKSNNLYSRAEQIEPLKGEVLDHNGILMSLASRKRIFLR